MKTKPPEICVHRTGHEGEKPGRSVRRCFAHPFKIARVRGDPDGRALELPRAISGHNSYRLWGPREIRGEPVIAIGIPRKQLMRYFGRVEQAGTARHRYAVRYEAERPIYLCRDPRVSPEELRRAMRTFI